MNGYIIAAAIFTITCVVSAIFFMKSYRAENFVRSFWLKGAAAVSFVAVGTSLLLFKENSAYASTVLLGLIFGLCGDQLLAIRLIHRNHHDLFFTIGALSFGVGHVVYVMAQRMIGEIHIPILLVAFLASAILSLIYARKKGTDVGEKTPLAIGYIAVVLTMGSAAISVAATTGSVAAILFSAGGILFGVSDNILCAYCYGKKPVWRMNRDLHITYYGAQLAIAWSILFI